MRIDVDRIACRGHGLCAGLLPEAVTLDDWGYPVVAAEVPDGLRRAARRAVAACPTLALRLAPPTPGTVPTARVPRTAPTRGGPS